MVISQSSMLQEKVGSDGLLTPVEPAKGTEVVGVVRSTDAELGWILPRLAVGESGWPLLSGVVEEADS